MRTTRTTLAIASLAAVTLTAACGTASSPDETPTATATSAAASAAVGAIDLSTVCPATVVVQTDWNPQSEQGGLFELLGPDATIDEELKAVRGSLVSGGEPTGVDIEIRAGGPAIGFQGVPAQMYQDREILLGWVNTDEAIVNSANLPTTAVLATFEKAPWMVMWDPETYPEVESIADLAEVGAPIRYFGGSTWMDYLLSSGIVTEEQLDATYDGSPATFVASGGTVAQQGFATNEPYVYEHELGEWSKPVAYELIADTGYPLYAVALAVRSEDVTAQADCLDALVPVIQQSTVDFFEAPDDVNALIVEAVERYGTGWVYPAAMAADSTTQQRALGLVTDGPGGTFGEFDPTRVATMLETVLPIMDDAGIEVAEDLAVEDLATNAFLDTAISFGDAG